MSEISTLRGRLVKTALEWEQHFGFAPAVTSALSELDAALLVGCSLQDYSTAMQGATPVQKGSDFTFKGIRYQVKASRNSGRPGSFVTLVARARNYDWDRLIWIHYNQKYEVQEAYQFEVDDYRKRFDDLKRLGPKQYREGARLAAIEQPAGPKLKNESQKMEFPSELQTSLSRIGFQEFAGSDELPKAMRSFSRLVPNQQQHETMHILPKHRWWVERELMEKNVWILFLDNRAEPKAWYLVPHDVMVAHALDNLGMNKTSKSWLKGLYHKRELPAKWSHLYAPFERGSVLHSLARGVECAAIAAGAAKKSDWIVGKAGLKGE